MNISDEQAIDLIIALDRECGDYCSRDDAIATWNVMDAGQRREMMEMHKNLCTPKVAAEFEVLGLMGGAAACAQGLPS